MPLTQEQLQAIPTVSAPSRTEAPAGAELIANHFIGDGNAGLFNMPIAVKGGQPVTLYQLSDILRGLADALSEAMDSGDRALQLAIVALQAQAATKAVQTGGIAWSIVSEDAIGIAQNGYMTSGDRVVGITLPAASPIGGVLEVVGIGDGGWQITQGDGQQIVFGNISSTIGQEGRLSSSHSKDAVRLICIAENTTWQVVSSIGSISAL